MNAHAERFNRTIQESFVDYHEELLFTDLALFNRKLADWLVFYNTERPTIPSASNLRYHSSCNINPSAKGTGLILLWPERTVTAVSITVNADAPNPQDCPLSDS
jgi:hypothetical protein